MLFVNEGYEDYTYIVESSDNYVVLTNQRSVDGSWDNRESIDVIYQYLTPSFLTIEDTREYSSSVSFNQIETTNDLYYRADCPSILVAGLALTILVCKVINMVTEFVEKGGII